MARPSKKNIYEKIEDKNNEILEAEKVLEKLNDELKELNMERDKEEMEKMLHTIRDKGLDITQALSLLSGETIKPNKK